MNHFPPELIDNISSYLSHDDLKKTLLLSEPLRFSAEKHSGAFNAFALHESNAEKFVDRFSGHRLLYLRKVEFSSPAQRDNIDQLEKNDESLTRQLMFLFITLETVENSAGRRYGPGKIELQLYTLLRNVSRKYIPPTHSQYLSWRAHLLEPEALPILGSIRSLEIMQGMYSPFDTDQANYRLADVKLDYRVMVDLIVKLPNIEYWGCRIGGDEWTPNWESQAARYLTRNWSGPRRDTRNDFAKALQSAKLPGTLQRIRLDFLHCFHYAERIDHLTAQPDLVKPEPFDPFCTSLHHLSQNLRRIHLRVVADESLFWPKDSSIHSWPNLESFIVMFHVVSPSGKWYFEGPKGEGRNTAAFDVTSASYPPLETTEYDEQMEWDIGSYGHRDTVDCNDQVRIVPNDTTLRPFLAAFATATAKMVSLKEAVLWCPLIWEPNNDHGSEYDSDDDDHAEALWLPETTLNHRSLAWGIYYLAAGEPDWTQSHSPSSVAPQLWWRVARWRPDSELHEIFKQIGRHSCSDTLIEHWVDAEHGEGLVERYYFESFIKEEIDHLGRIPARS